MDRHSHDRTMRRLGTLALVLSAVLAIVLLATQAFAAPAFPKLTGRVTDAANILPAATEASIDTQLAGLEKATTTQLVVATVPDLQGYEIDEFGYQLGRAWGIGQKGTNNGAVLIVAPNEKKVRIEVGYGLEGTLTDAVTSQIIRRNIVPYFKAGDMAGGVAAGTNALVKLLELPAGERNAAVQAASLQASGGGGGGPGAGTFIWLAILVLWLVIAISRRRRGVRSGPAIVWGPGMGGWGGGGGGWGGGGGGFGGGGFGGGGGGFGGGGSSGSW